MHISDGKYVAIYGNEKKLFDKESDALLFEATGQLAPKPIKVEVMKKKVVKKTKKN